MEGYEPAGALEGSREGLEDAAGAASSTVTLENSPTSTVRSLRKRAKQFGSGLVNLQTGEILDGAVS